MIRDDFVLWTTGVGPTGNLYGLPFVNTLDETNHLSVERIDRNKRTPYS
jgi:hypothetical protein